MDIIEASDAKIGAVIYAVAAHVKESKEYERHMSRKQMEEQFKDLFNRADHYHYHYARKRRERRTEAQDLAACTGRKLG